MANYVVEVLSRLATARDYAASLLAADHVSRAPKILASTIRKTTDFLSRAVQNIYREHEAGEQSERDLALTLRSLQGIDDLMRELAGQLRYVEAATTYKLPWTMVAAFEDWAGTFLPKVTLMLRPQWRYNYTFTLWDFRDNYRLALEELQDHVEDLDLEQGVLDEFSNPFYLIAFPALERDNILLHTLLGHEIGHLLVDDFLTEELESRFVQEVRGIVTDLTRKQLRDQGLSEDEVGQIFWPDLEKFWIASNLREVVEVWKRALEEILSDIAGAFLFGPAALFSTFELAFQYGFDEAPASRNNFYPPWRRRLREVLRVLGAEDGFFPIPSSAFPEGEAAMRSRALKQYYSDIEREAGLRKDEDAINKMPLVRSVYAALPEYIRLGKEFLLDDCRLGEHLLEADQLYRATPALIERLDNKIPPDQKGRSSNRRRDSDFVEIINAAWLHKVSSVASLTPACPPLEQQALIERDVRNRLTLKAIEFSSLSRRFEGM